MSLLSRNVNVTIPAPYVFSPSQTWEGSDGSWSSFYVRVGSPEQNFRVFVSTASGQTWIPDPEGCRNDYATCGPLRGVAPFNNEQSNGYQVNVSSTWNEIGIFGLELEKNLNYTGAGHYGLETVGLQIQNSGGLQLEKQVVATIATKDFYYGYFGLDPRPSNFSTFDDPQPSFMRTLRDQKSIPGLGFGYTAGAPYRFQKVLGSLVLGGYDQSRFTPNSITFPFGPNDSRSFTLGLQSITAINSLQGTVTLLSQGILSFIDSTVPHIWLPRSVCDRFEEVFGLAYDPTTDLYLINDTMRSELQNKNPTITFRLGASVVGGESVNIVLPYSAFDLQAKHPIYPNATNYFPIRRGANDTQYVLGRTFLQEAYLVANYENATFKVGQAVFANPMPRQEIVSILSPEYQNLTNSTSEPADTNQASSALSTGAIAGIAVGAALGVALIIGLIIWRVLKRRRHRRKAAELPSTNEVTGPTHGRYEMPTGSEKYELASPDAVPEMDSKKISEMDGDRRVELDAMDAMNTTHGYLDPRFRAQNLAPAELPGTPVEEAKR